MQIVTTQHLCTSSGILFKRKNYHQRRCAKRFPKARERSRTTRRTTAASVNTSWTIACSQSRRRCRGHDQGSGASSLALAISGAQLPRRVLSRGTPHVPVQTILAFDPSSNTYLLYFVCKPPARRAESRLRGPAGMGRRRPAAAAAPVRAPPGLPRSRKSRSTWPATLAAGAPPESRRNRCKRSMDKQRTQTKAN